MSAAPLLLLAALAAGQEVQTSTDTVDLTTAAPPGFVMPPEEPKPELARPLRVKLHKEGKDWEPVSVRAGAGDALAMSTSFERRIVRKKGRRSKAKAVARLFPKGEDKVLIVSIFPEALKKKRIHVELRMKLVEGWLEEVKVAAITAEGEAAEEHLDSRKLKLAGIPFSEDFPAEAALSIVAIDPAGNAKAVNAGRLKAEFGLEDLGLVSLTYKTKGVNLKETRKKGGAEDPRLPGCPDDARRPDVPVLRGRAREYADAEDFEQAYLSACRAARFGDPEAQHMIAHIFHHGYGRRPRDLKLAAHWYTKAARGNFAPSAGVLALLLKDPRQAHSYLVQAARLGHGPSQARLGAAYRAGRLEERDFVEAYRWYWLAHQKRTPGAQRALDELAAEMSPMQVEEARRRAALLLSQPKPFED